MNVEKKEQQNFSNKKVGVFTAKVVAINPDSDKICQLLNVSEENQDKFKDVEYLGEDQEGNTRLNLHFYLQEKNGDIFTLRFSLIDKKRVSKSGLFQYINQTGGTSYADSEENLPVWFKTFQDKEKNIIGDKEFREAYVGEEELYNFMTTWLDVDLRKPSNNLFLNWKQLMRGNTKELSDLVGTDMTTEFGALATVRIVEKDDSVKEYQSVFTKAFIPAWKMKHINKAMSTDDWTAKEVKSFYEAVTGEYGCKDQFLLCPLKEYKSEEFIASTGNAIADSESKDY